ncbi:MAG TPA: AAA family ATPase [Pirellulales bacterium]|jgi:uncharacterized protein YhaN|nr:AAA family ATPase [Pirellulales bacterium]
MRISDLRIDGFGVWNGLELGELSDQLNVLYGPNEAGKTTLLEFVRSVLYGFSAERVARYFPPVHGGAPGGSLRVSHGQQTLVLRRYVSDGQENWSIVPLGRAETADDDLSLSALLGDVDETIFNNVFAVGLREIQELAGLSGTQAASELYSLALGLDRVSLVEVLADLDVSRDRLLAADGRPSVVPQLLAERERLQEELGELGQATRRYLSLLGERDSLDAEVARLEREQLTHQERTRELSLARALKDPWERRAALDAQLEALRKSDSLPPDALARFDRLRARWRRIRQKVRNVRRRRARLLEQAKGLAVNAALCEQAPRFEALAEQQQWMEWLAAEVARLEEEVLELESQRESTAPPNSRGRGPLSARMMEELRGTARALRAARRQWREWRAANPAAEREQPAATIQVPAAPRGVLSGQELTDSLAESGELVSKLRKRVQLDERLDQLSRRQVELDERSQELLDNQILPAWALGTLGSFFVLGSALVLLFAAGLILPASLGDALGWPVGIVGLLIAGGAGAMKLAMERGVRGDLDNCNGQIAMLKDQVEQTRQERDALDRELPRGGGPLVARLQAAEKSLAELEGLLPAARQREATERESQVAAETAAQHRGQLKSLRKKWGRLLAAAGLPADLAPKQLSDVTRRSTQGRAIEGQIAERSNELARRRAEFETLAGRVRQLVTLANVAPKTQQPLEQLRQCLSELAEQQQLGKERANLKRKAALFRKRQRKLARTAARLSRRRQAMFHAAGVLDEIEFRGRAAVQADVARLSAERTSVAHDITAALGSYSEAQFAEWLARHANLERAQLEQAELARTVDETLRELLGKRGELKEQLKTLAENRQLGFLRLELDRVDRQLQEAIERWQVLAVCSLFLLAVRDYYEREHQPQALQEASAFLVRLTGGRYTRVWTPLGQHVLKVDDDQGRTLDAEVLSSGTREQLFLALRLALVNSYSKRGMELPLVLDDVLVNFDVGRAKAAAIVLRDFARHGHQVFVLTCHEHIYKLFRSLKCDARQLPERAQGGASGGSIKRRRLAEAIPEPEEVIAVVEAEAPAAPAPLISQPQQAVHVEVPVAPVKIVNRQPRPAAAAPSPPRVRRQSVTTRWSAEEFEGELTDRVRGSEVLEPASPESANPPNGEEDAEAA